MPAVRSATLALVLSASVTCVAGTAEWEPLPTETTQDGSLSFHEIGSKCGFGEEAYYGYIGGDVSLKKVFIEIMGGAVCFSHESCQDTWFGAWMSITNYLTQKADVPESQVDTFKSGFPLPLSMMANPIKPGYFPLFKGDNTHHMRNWPGIFFPTCTGDIMGGRHKLDYTNTEGEIMEAHHYGAINLNKVLDGVKVAWPELEEITIMGGSGGAVTASVWMSKVAEMWPTAKVNALVDSGFHMFPGGDFFDFFYNNIGWSPGPGGDNAGKVPDIDMPAWAWLEDDAIVKDLETYKGRLRVAYIACNRDDTVFSDRRKMSSYSTFNGSTIQQQVEMWHFLTTLQAGAPEKSAYSYIMDCAEHHLTQGGWNDQINPEFKLAEGEPTLDEFIRSFFSGVAPKSTEEDKTHFWFAPAPTPAPTQEPSEEVNGSFRPQVLDVALLFMTLALTCNSLV